MTGFGLLLIGFIPMLLIALVMSWIIEPKQTHKDDKDTDSLDTLMQTGQITPQEYNELKLKTLPFKR